MIRYFPYSLFVPIFIYHHLLDELEGLPPSRGQCVRRLGHTHHRASITLYDAARRAEELGLCSVHHFRRPYVIKWLSMTEIGADLFMQALDGKIEVALREGQAPPSQYIADTLPNLRMTVLSHNEYKQALREIRLLTKS